MFKMSGGLLAATTMLLALLAAPAAVTALRPIPIPVSGLVGMPHLLRPRAVQDPPKPPTKCEKCIASAEKFLPRIIEAASAGVVVSCAAVCEPLKNSTLEYAACNTVCDAVGAAAIAMSNVSDITSFYVCELVKVCTITAGGAVSVKGISVYPSPKVTATSKVWLPMTGKVDAATSPGEVLWEMFHAVPGKGNSTQNVTVAADRLVNEGYPVGGLYVGWELNLTAHKSVPAGPYTVRATMCEGKCGSALPHSSLLAVAEVMLTVAAGPGWP